MGTGKPPRRPVLDHPIYWGKQSEVKKSGDLSEPIIESGGKDSTAQEQGAKDTIWEGGGRPL